MTKPSLQHVTVWACFGIVCDTLSVENSADANPVDLLRISIFAATWPATHLQKTKSHSMFTQPRLGSPCHMAFPCPPVFFRPSHAIEILPPDASTSVPSRGQTIMTNIFQPSKRACSRQVGGARTCNPEEQRAEENNARACKHTEASV